MACVIGVLVGLLAIAEGFSQFVKISDGQGLVLVLREGTDVETRSPMNFDEVPHISNSKYVRRDSYNEPLASPELLWRAILTLKKNHKDEMLGWRGVTNKAEQVRKNFKIIQGRNFSPGLNEVIIGKSLLGKYEGVEVGKSIKIMGVDWLVVGVFGDGGSVAESEIWVDLPVLQGILPWGKAVHSVRLLLNNVQDLEKYNAELTANKQVQSRGELELEYNKRLSKKITDTVSTFTYPVVLLMALGAVAGIVISVFNSIDEKKKQIGTLKVLGFRNSAVFSALIIETAMIALLGALIGTTVVYLLFNGHSAATSSGDTLAVQFKLSINAVILAKALLLSLVLGVLAAIPPAIYAVRLPMNKALQ
jgi:putative ABC transport system permease protein